MRTQENNSHTYIYMILTAQNDLLMKFQRGRSQIIHDRAAPHISRKFKECIEYFKIHSQPYLLLEVC